MWLPLVWRRVPEFPNSVDNRALNKPLPRNHYNLGTGTASCKGICADVIWSQEDFSKIALAKRLWPNFPWAQRSYTSTRVYYIKNPFPIFTFQLACSVKVGSCSLPKSGVHERLYHPTPLPSTTSNLCLSLVSKYRLPLQARKLLY